MKLILNCVALTALLLVISCQEDEIKNSSGTITADDFIYNKAINYSLNEDGGTVQVNSQRGVQLVYAYLVRNFVADSLIFRGFPEAGNEREYTFKIPYKNFPASSIENVKGVKLMVKQNDNSTLEGFVNLSVYDPAAPAFHNFPEELTPDITGTTASSITGTITSDGGLKQVDIYDNYKGEWALVHSFSSLNGVQDYAFNYDYTYRKAAVQLRIDATDIYERTQSITIDLDVDLTLFAPVFTGFPELVQPNASDEATTITGTITSLTGLAQIDIYDDYQGTYVLVESITGLNGATAYDFNYDYYYRKRAKHLKIEAIDTDGVSANAVVEFEIILPYHLYENVTMMGQGTTSQNSETSFFVGQTGTPIGNCEISGNESIADFLVYASSAGLVQFYAPTNTTNVASNYRCDGVSWVPDVGSLKATRFRVLVPGSTETDNIYALYEADVIGELDDEFFTGISVPSSSAVGYDPSVAPSATRYNLTTTYLIWVRIPNGDGTFTNGLIHVKQVNIASPTGLSTKTFDILLQK